MSILAQQMTNPWWVALIVAAVGLAGVVLGTMMNQARISAREYDMLVRKALCKLGCAAFAMLMASQRHETHDTNLKMLAKHPRLMANLGIALDPDDKSSLGAARQHLLGNREEARNSLGAALNTFIEARAELAILAPCGYSDTDVGSLLAMVTDPRSSSDQGGDYLANCIVEWLNARTMILPARPKTRRATLKWLFVAIGMN